MIDPLDALAFTVAENKGVFALLVGSGLSRAAEVPTGWEIVLNLTRRIAALEGAGEQPDLTAWHQDRFGEPPNYSRLLDRLTQTAEERRAVLHGFIEPSTEDIKEGRRVPTKGHRAIARLVRDGYVRVVVTTNFDRLLENALRDEGVEPTVIRSDDDLQGALPLIHSRCFVIKVHGDYLDTRIRNTECELDSYSPPMDQLLDRVFDEHGLIVCGWSGEWDQALRNAIARAPSRRFPMYWASRKPPAGLAADLVEQRRGRVVAVMSADDFFEGLQSKLETLATLHSPHPLSVAMQVAAAKRYVSRPEFRIQLDDLVRAELRKARETFSDPGLGPSGRVDAREFQRRLALYEAASEPLVRLAFVLGRWGGRGETTLMLDLLGELGVRKTYDGTVVWLGLQTYPGVLLFYAYGIGALKAGRMQDVVDWLNAPLRSARRDENRIAAMELLLWSWDAGRDDFWKLLPEYKDRQTPLSDYLLERLARWIGSEFISSADLELSFGRFETFATVANILAATPKEDLRAQLSSQTQTKFAWAPVGRTGWHRTREAIIPEIDSDTWRATVLAAGLADGDADHLRLALTNLERLHGQFRFW